ncbi:MAG TPA: hypothetical protein VMS86_06655 [Thermoanaerobaculia bacterium]|nr:hypothetical protein [Thermoanaerobaculia bacterium]
MSTARKVYLTVAIAAAVLLVALWLQPTVKRTLSPRPVAAYVAIEPAPGAPARVGPVEISAGAPFRLHAVLEAEGRGGEPVYYTAASALSIGGVEVAADRLRRWNESWRIRILWFTVEPWARFVELEPGEDLDAVRYQEFFHPEWPMQWAVEGRLDARSDDRVENTVGEPRRFGTQRYQVWIELYDDERALVPSSRFRSWGVADLEPRVDEFPTVTAVLPAPAAPASAAFGLTAVALPPDASAELRAEAARRAEKRLLFSELWLLREILRAAGSDLDTLAWRRVDLQEGLRWSEEISAGDLLRVGARWVVAYRDRDGDGVLGAADLCLDFERGAAIRQIGDVFVGEGEIEWARLAT